MPSANGETAAKDMIDQTIYQRLEKDIAAVRNELAALADQIAGAARRRAQQGYKQARANVDSAVGDLSERSGAMVDAAQDAADSIGKSLEDAIVERPLTAVGLALGLGFLIGVTWRR